MELHEHRDDDQRHRAAEAERRHVDAEELQRTAPVQRERTVAVILDARWEYEFETGAYVGLGFGAAVHDGETGGPGADERALGSPVLFHIPVEAGYRFDGHHGVSLYFDHISNANLADHNEGLNTLGLRYGYRF